MVQRLYERADEGRRKLEDHLDGITTVDGTSVAPDVPDRATWGRLPEHIAANQAAMALHRPPQR